MNTKTDVYALAKPFITQVYEELKWMGVEERLQEIEEEIARTGTYIHTTQELEYGVRMAWRNSNRCIGRLYWKSLILLDKRKVTSTQEVFEALESHLQLADNEGKILPIITVFPPQQPDGTVPFKIWNKNLIRYAAHKNEDGQIVGDPDQWTFTQYCKSWGWEGQGTRFDLLPLVVQVSGKAPEWRNLDPSKITEVALQHPDYNWFSDLQLKWHILPVISDMVLEMGGILYPTAPFNGWYMVTEIGSRNFGDEKRYNQLAQIAKKMELQQDKQDPFWKDKALLVLNEAVYHSFKKAGVSITDHHSASAQFMKFLKNEALEGRDVQADWSWIVPPLSSSSMEVFHEEFNNEVITPNFFYNHKVWDTKPEKTNCPFHISSRDNR